jgi:hypothetical protein
MTASHAFFIEMRNQLWVIHDRVDLVASLKAEADSEHYGTVATIVG